MRDKYIIKYYKELYIYFLLLKDKYIIKYYKYIKNY